MPDDAAKRFGSSASLDTAATERDGDEPRKKEDVATPPHWLPLVLAFQLGHGARPAFTEGLKMRPFLLVSALVVAHAQLMPLAAWPMRGRTALHTANGLVAAPGNHAVVVKYQTGGWVESSPAIGADGTVYVGSNDGNLYALSTADGSRMWQYQTRGSVSSSPAIGADFTVYVGSDDGNLYALSTVSPDAGSLNWQYPTGGAIRSSPAIGADGTVYVGSDDHNLYALIPDGPDEDRLKWQQPTGGAIRSSPAIGADGTVYVGSNDGNLYAFSPSDGSVKWLYQAGPQTEGACPCYKCDDSRCYHPACEVVLSPIPNPNPYPFPCPCP